MLRRRHPRWLETVLAVAVACAYAVRLANCGRGAERSPGLVLLDNVPIAALAVAVVTSTARGAFARPRWSGARIVARLLGLASMVAVLVLRLGPARIECSGHLACYPALLVFAARDHFPRWFVLASVAFALVATAMKVALFRGPSVVPGLLVGLVLGLVAYCEPRASPPRHREVSRPPPAVTG